MNQAEANSQFYKGYEIYPFTKELLNGKWDLEIIIKKYREESVTEKQFESLDRFNSYEEAYAACIIFGRNIIDDNIDGLSAP